MVLLLRAGLYFASSRRALRRRSINYLPQLSYAWTHALNNTDSPYTACQRIAAFGVHGRHEAMNQRRMEPRTCSKGDIGGSSAANSRRALAARFAHKRFHVNRRMPRAGLHVPTAFMDTYLLVTTEATSNETLIVIWLTLR
jgi:hypothetical protein